MIHRKQNATLEEVLADYANSAEGFDATRLQQFVHLYPDLAPALRRYAQVQLSSVRASADEIEAEEVPVNEMLLGAAKLKLASIAGRNAIRSAAAAVFGSCEHGEDMLLVCVKDAGVTGIPGWVYERLANYVDSTASALRSLIPPMNFAAAEQRFSAPDKPKESPASSWEKAVEMCISDVEIRQALLSRSQ